MTQPAGKPDRTLSAHSGTAVFLLGFIAVVGLRFWQLRVADAPPGADGGDWLAFAYQLFGQHVRAADAASPPLVPVLIWMLMAVVSPLAALKLVAVFTSVAVAVPLYLTIRREVPSVPSAIIALTFPLTGYHSETMAWGGYPQLLGVAFLVAALLTLGEGLIKGSRPRLIASGVCAALTVGSHQMAAAALVIAAPVFIICLAVQVRPVSRAFLLWPRNLLVWGAAAAAFSLPFVPFYVRIIELARGNPANPQGYSSVTDAANYAFKDEPLLWAFLTLGGVAFCLATLVRRRGSNLAASATALFVASSVIFASLYEVRAFHIFQVGVFESVALSFAALLMAAKVTSLGSFSGWTGRLAVAAALVAVVATLAVRGYERSQDTMAYYRVVDTQVLEALGWLEQHSAPGSLVVAGENQRDGPYSWWVEGISKRPAYSTDLKFLHGYNKEEQDQIVYATQLLSPATSAADATRLIQARHIDYFFVDKFAPQEFAYLLGNVQMRVVFENQEIEILAP